MNRIAWVVAAVVLAAGCFTATSAGDPDASTGDGGGGSDAAKCAVPCGTDCCTGANVCGPVTRRCELPCQPQCSSRKCGNDGCGGSCGSCGGGTRCDTSSGSCQACTAQCSGKVCGDDSCSGTCGTCSNGASCVSGQCVVAGGTDGGSPGDAGPGGPDASTAGADAGVVNGSAESACLQFYGVALRRISECYSGSQSTWGAFANFKGLCADLGRGVSAGRVSFDGSQLNSCISQYSSATCEQAFLSDGAFQPSACLLLFKGVVPLGGTCWAAPFECGQDATCRRASGSCSGTCVARAQPGTSCANASCVESATCNNGICALRLTQGASCTLSSAVLCKSTLYCKPTSAGSSSGACQPTLSLGASCDGYGACGLYRNVCRGFTGGAPGTCVQRTAIGSACQPGLCEFLSACINGTCTDSSPVGGPCFSTGTTDTLSCADGYCQNGTCAAKLGAGASCPSGSGGSCLSGTCAGGTCTAPCAAP